MKPIPHLAAALVLALTLAPITASAVAGLDPAFGSNGVATFRPGVASGSTAAALQPDGKLLVAGWSGVNAQGVLTGPVARLDPDGNLDESFGTGGFASTTKSVEAIVVRADARIDVISRDSRVTRLMPDGSVDTSFGVNGVVSLVFEEGKTPSVHSALAVAGGKTLLAGASGGKMLLARVLEDGSLDPTFATAGFLTASVFDYDEFLTIALQSDGRIVVAGSAYESLPRKSGVLMRFSPDGAVDSSFGTGSGAVVLIGPGMDSAFHEIRVLPDDRIVFVGATGSFFLTGFPMSTFLAGRYTANGLLDPSFGSGGLVFLPGVPGESDYYASLTVQPDGRIVAGGARGNDESMHMSLLRLLPDGQLDGSFGSGGQLENLGAGYRSGITKLVLAPSRKLYAVGSRTRAYSPDTADMLAARYDLGPSSSDVDFNADGKPDIIWSNTANGATYLWYMNGPVLGIDALIAQIDPAWKIQGVADFNGDGHPDFLMRNSVSGVAFVWFFHNATPIGDQFLFGIDPAWKVEGVADMNADGQPDLLFRNMGSGLAFAWNTQYGGGNLSLASASAPIFSIDPAWEIVQMADWNGDGSPDLLFRNRDTGVVFVWYMNGTTLAGSDYVTQIDPSWEIVPRR